MNTHAPHIAVVILNYNGKKFLSDFLPAVLQTEYTNYSVWVADNASTDDSVSFLQSNYNNTIKLVQLTENHGFAGGYNLALQQIRADYYVLLNSDVEVTPNWLAPMVELLENDTLVAAVQPKIRSYRDRHLLEHAGGAGGYMDALAYPLCRGRVFSHLETDKGQYDDRAECFWATGAAMCVRASLFHDLGGLDADFFAHMEEIDWCWRAKRAGYKIMVCPEAVVYHVGGGTLQSNNPHKNYLNFRNSLVSITKNETAAKLLWHLPARLVLDGVAGVRFLREGKWIDVLMIVKAHWYFFFHFFYILKKRHREAQLIEKCRVAPPNITTGIIDKSIVWSFFVQNKKMFSEL